MKRKNFFALANAVYKAVTATDFDRNGNGSANTSGTENIENNDDVDISHEIISFGGRDWRVLEVKDDRSLIISNGVIEQRDYHSERVSITWADSDIRQYLNGEFYSTFSDEDKARIIETQVVNRDNPWFGTDGGVTTIDKVFLLSMEEVVKYFGDSGKLSNRPDSTKTFFRDKYSDSRVAYSDERDGLPSWWWLRSLGDGSGTAANVGEDGELVVGGNDVNEDWYGGGGVRPALWLKL